MYREMLLVYFQVALFQSFKQLLVKLVTKGQGYQGNTAIGYNGTDFTEWQAGMMFLIAKYIQCGCHVRGGINQGTIEIK